MKFCHLQLYPPFIVSCVIFKMMWLWKYSQTLSNRAEARSSSWSKTAWQCSSPRRCWKLCSPCVWPTWENTYMYMPEREDELENLTFLPVHIHISLLLSLSALSTILSATYSFKNLLFARLKALVPRGNRAWDEYSTLMSTDSSASTSSAHMSMSSFVTLCKDCQAKSSYNFTVSLYTYMYTSEKKNENVYSQPQLVISDQL